MPASNGRAVVSGCGGKVFFLGAALLICLLELSCTGATIPASLNSLEIGQSQSNLAGYYDREALVMRQRADEYAQQAHLYEELFGPESDWVSGARLLSQFYEESAWEQQRLADVHRQLNPQ